MHTDLFPLIKVYSSLQNEQELLFEHFLQLLIELKSVLLHK